jgi:hypothetical protein
MTSWQVVKMTLIGATTALVAAAIIAPVVATPAAAADFTRTPHADGPDIITISGIIYPGDNRKFVQVVLETKHASIVLDSRGGYVEDAIAIGGLVRSRNYETRVENGALCNSACTLIWLAGASRRLGSHARLGFHSAATAMRPPYKRNEPANGTIALYMARLGVPQQVIDLQPKADPCCLNYIDHAQAKAWGLLSDRSAKQQVLPTPQTQQPAVGQSWLPRAQPTEEEKQEAWRSIQGELPSVKPLPHLPAAMPATGQSVPCVGIICPMLTIPIEPEHLSAKPRWHGTIPDMILPPAEFDKPYKGKLQIVKVDDYAIVHSICQNDYTKSRRVSAFACAIHTARYCLILLGPTVWDNEEILRHEIGHCNGWPQDHRAAR